MTEPELNWRGGHSCPPRTAHKGPKPVAAWEVYPPGRGRHPRGGLDVA